MMRYSMRVSGKVQGVFYRDFAKLEAEKIGILGYVKNLGDGTVEIVAEGEDAALKKFLASCRKGPLMAFVKNVGFTEAEATNEFESFDIRH